MRSKRIGAYTAVVFILILFIFVVNAGRFLAYNDEPKKADVIAVLSGGRGGRTEYGVELYKEGYSKRLIFSGGEVYNKVTMAELMKNHAMELGVPGEYIVVEDKAASTYQNAVFVKDIMVQRGYRSAIIVTSNYHMRRTNMVFDKEFKDTGISLTYCAAVDENFNPKRWWANNNGIMITINEYIKFIGYALGKAS